MATATRPRIWTPPSPKPKPVTPHEAMDAALGLIEIMFECRAWPGTLSIDARRVAELLDAALAGKAVAR